MPVKYYHLKAGDQAMHGETLYTFQKVDGMYAQWLDPKGEIVIGSAMEYDIKDGIYYPVNSLQSCTE